MQRSILLHSVEELDGWKRKLRVGITVDEVEEKRKELFSELAREAEMPGFRKGKVPHDVLERRHGDKLRRDALLDLVWPAYVKAVQAAGIRPVCDPEFSELDDEPTEGTYHFTATVEVRPEIELKEYKGLEFTERVPIVKDEDVVRALDELREQQAELIPASRPSAEGDILVIDYVRIGDDGEPVEGSGQNDFACEVGSGGLLPEIDAALKGVSAGDEKTVAVKPPKPEGETDVPDEVSFQIVVKDVREKRLPEADDAFARSVGRFETLLELRVKIRESLEAEAKSRARRALEEEIVRTIIEKNPFELPEGLVKQRLDAMYERMSEGRPDDAEPIDREQMETVYRPMVEHQLKAGLILSAVAEKHEIKVGRADIEARLKAIAESRGKETSELIDELKGTDAFEQIEDDVWLEKVHAFLVDGSRITTEQIELSGGPAGEKPEGGE